MNRALVILLIVAGVGLLAAGFAAAVLPVGVTEFSSAYLEIDIYGGPIGVLYLRLGSSTCLGLAGAVFVLIGVRKERTNEQGHTARD